MKTPPGLSLPEIPLLPTPKKGKTIRNIFSKLGPKSREAKAKTQPSVPETVDEVRNALAIVRAFEIQIQGIVAKDIANAA